VSIVLELRFLSGIDDNDSILTDSAKSECSLFSVVSAKSECSLFSVVGESSEDKRSHS